MFSHLTPFRKHLTRILPHSVAAQGGRGLTFALIGWCCLAAACGHRKDSSDPTPVPTSIVVEDGNGQNALVNEAVLIDPVALVTDADGDPVSGVRVTFLVTSGGGIVQGSIAQTDGQGLAHVSAWILGPAPGPNTLTATINGTALSVTFSATGIVLGSAYNIDVRPVSALTPTQLAAFTAAAARLEQLIVGDETNLLVTLNAGDCFANQPAMNETIDDIVIFAEVGPIDGAGGILGQAGPCLLRSLSFHPIVGFMRFDVADLNTIEANGLLQTVILHEMQHVLGFGTIWTSRGVLSGQGGADPFFTGSNAIAAFNAIGGQNYPGPKVPVENTGGPGTRDGHWRETIFGSELMTGFVNIGTNPLSVVTVESFHDIGYQVDTGTADNFSVGPFPGPPAVPGVQLNLGNDLWTGPLFEVDRAGKVRPIPRQ